MKRKMLTIEEDTHTKLKVYAALIKTNISDAISELLSTQKIFEEHTEMKT